jgi:hypothetical protein
VKHVVERGIWVPTQHLLWGQGKPWSSWPVAGPSGCKLNSSQQSGIKHASPNISSHLHFFPFENIYKLFLQTFLCVYNSNKHKTVYKTCGADEVSYFEGTQQNRCFPLHSWTLTDPVSETLCFLLIQNSMRRTKSISPVILKELPDSVSIVFFVS